MDRIAIESTLNKDRAWLLDALAAMPAEELNRPATKSEHDPSLWWSMGDHFVHLALIEHNFVAMIRRFLAGEPNPVGLRQRDDGSERSMEEVMKSVHTMTEDWATKHRGKSLAELVQVTQVGRAATLQLLSELTDEQLTQTLPGAPWADGTIGGVLAVHAGHGRMHFQWAKAGLESESPNVSERAVAQEFAVQVADVGAIDRSFPVAALKRSLLALAGSPLGPLSCSCAGRQGELDAWSAILEVA